MPIYEFYCPACHTIFNFFSWKVDTETTPACPQCKGKKMERQTSVFAVTGRAKEPAAGGPEGGADLPFDEAKMGKAMQVLEKEAGNINEEDPKQAARLMRRLTDLTGMKLSGTMQEALRRLEAGENPDAVEAELGPRLESEELFQGLEKKSGAAPRRLPPRRDKTLYEMNAGD